MGEIKKVKMEDAEQLVGGCIILWRNEQKQAAKVLAVDKNEKKITYELRSGPDKDQKFKSRYDSSQIIDLYDEDAEIVALLAT